MLITDTLKSSILKKAFGKNVIVDADGKNYTFLCPNPKCGSHVKNKLKFVVRLEDSTCHCWVCGLKGRNAGYVIRKYKPDLLEQFLTIYDVKLNNDLTTQNNIQSSYQLPEDFQLIADLVERGALLEPDTAAVLRYLKSRQIDISQMWRYKIGVSNEPGYRRSALFPSFDIDGNVTFCQSRKIWDDGKSPKYKNHGAKSKEIIFDEIHLLTDERVHIFEGVFDLIRAGVNGTCLLGSFLSTDGALFKRLASDRPPVTLCLDNDAEDKAIKIGKVLLEFGIDVSMAILPNKADPGSMPKDQLLEKLANAQPLLWKNKMLSKIATIRSGTFLT